MRLIDADRLKSHYSWWEDDNQYKRIFNEIIDVQETLGSTCERCKLRGTPGCVVDAKVMTGFCAWGEEDEAD